MRADKAAKVLAEAEVIHDATATEAAEIQVHRATVEQHPEVVAEDFPGYVPELNPDEGVWGWTKYGRLANLAAEDVERLWDEVVEELIELKQNPDLLRAFLRQTGLPGVLRVA